MPPRSASRRRPAPVPPACPGGACARWPASRPACARPRTPLRRGCTAEAGASSRTHPRELAPQLEQRRLVEHPGARGSSHADTERTEHPQRIVGDSPVRTGRRGVMARALGHCLPSPVSRSRGHHEGRFPPRRGRVNPSTWPARSHVAKRVTLEHPRPPCLGYAARSWWRRSAPPHNHPAPRPSHRPVLYPCACARACVRLRRSGPSSPPARRPSLAPHPDRPSAYITERRASPAAPHPRSYFGGV